MANQSVHMKNTTDKELLEEKTHSYMEAVRTNPHFQDSFVAMERGKALGSRFRKKVMRAPSSLLSADAAIQLLAKQDLQSVLQMVGPQLLLQRAVEVSGMDIETACNMIKVGGQEQEPGELQRRIRKRIESKNMFEEEKSPMSSHEEDAERVPAIVSVVCVHTPERYALVDTRIKRPHEEYLDELSGFGKGTVPPGARKNALPSVLLRDFHQRYLVYHVGFENSIMLYAQFFPFIWPIFLIGNMLIDTLFMIPLGITATCESLFMMLRYGVFTSAALAQRAIQVAKRNGDWDEETLDTGAFPVHFMVPTVNNFLIMESFLVSLLVITVEVLNLVVSIPESNSTALWTAIGLIVLQFGLNNLMSFIVFAVKDASDEKKVYALQSTGMLPDAAGNFFKGRLDAIDQSLAKPVVYTYREAVFYSFYMVWCGSILGFANIVRSKFWVRGFVAELIPAIASAVVLVNIIIFALIKSVEDGASDKEVFEACEFAAIQGNVSGICGESPSFFGRGLFLNYIGHDITMILFVYLLILFAYLTAELSRLYLLL
eukprot:m.349390 g.349390  ORF g.349390 m.349390 type:complete len:544 (+) comp41961_c0_seq1:319-1950(+)